MVTREGEGDVEVKGEGQGKNLMNARATEEINTIIPLGQVAAYRRYTRP